MIRKRTIAHAVLIDIMLGNYVNLCSILFRHLWTYDHYGVWEKN